MLDGPGPSGMRHGLVQTASPAFALVRGLARAEAGVLFLMVGLIRAEAEDFCFPLKMPISGRTLAVEEGDLR